MNRPVQEIDSTLEQLEQGAAVRLVASYPIVSCGHEARVAEVLASPAAVSIDVIPVSDGRSIIGVLMREGAKGALAREGMVPLHSGMLVSASDPVLPVLESLTASNEFRLVLEDGQVCGIVTLSDLQKLPVRSLLFARITHLEILMADLICARMPHDSWLDRLGAARRQRVQSKWQALRSGNADLDQIEATDFCDKRDLAIELELVAGPSRTKIKERLVSVERLRDKLAHAGEYAGNVSDARNTLAVMRDLRALIQELRARLPLPPASQGP